MAETKEKPKRCFVISPIGAEGSEIREHADLVLELIIRPAMEELGIESQRSDDILMTGRVTDQMVSALTGDDLCIALLTYQNPNVFYELAIAQSAARPTIIMIRKGGTIPFDLHDLRRIEYDFSRQAIRDKVYVRQLVDRVRSIAENGWRAPVPFGQSLSPLGQSSHAAVPQASPSFRMYEDSEDFGGEKRWLELLSEAETSIRAAGIAMTRWVSPRARELLLKKAQAGCEIKVLMMAPDNPGLRSLINEVDGINTVSAVAETINRVHSIMSEWTKINDRVQFKLIKTGSLHQQLVLTDRVATARLYCYSRTITEAPVIYLRRPTPLADAFDEEFDALWRLN